MCPVRSALFVPVSSEPTQRRKRKPDERGGSDRCRGGPGLRLCRRRLLPELECRRHDGPSVDDLCCVSCRRRASFPAWELRAGATRRNHTSGVVSDEWAAREAARRFGEATLDRMPSERSIECRARYSYGCRETSNHAPTLCVGIWRILALLWQLWDNVVSRFSQHWRISLPELGYHYKPSVGWFSGPLTPLEFSSQI